jgi:hypothetical protein
MSEIKGNLLMYLKLQVKPNDASLALIAQVFAKTAADLGIACSGAQVDSAGKTARIRASDVTGFTEAPSPVAASWTPGVLSVEIRQHPGGFEGARAEAERMARRLADATGCQVGPPHRMKSKRHMAVQAMWPVSGLRLPVLAITADFTPAGGG